MVNLFLTEVLKLKRSSMFLISILGAAVAPFVVVIATYLNEPSILFKELFYNVNLYTVLIIGVPLYGVVMSRLGRDYIETGKYIEKYINHSCVTHRFYCEQNASAVYMDYDVDTYCLDTHFSLGYANAV